MKKRILSTILGFTIVFGVNAQHTELVTDINTWFGQDTDIDEFYEYNGKLYFSAEKYNSGEELWVYDGVNTPTLAFDINPGEADGNPQYFEEYNGLLYFKARNGTSGSELFSFDGIAPPVLIDLNAGPDGSSPSHLTTYNGELYMAIDTTGNYSRQLYKYNGTTLTIADTINTTGGTDFEEMYVYGNELIISANDGAVGYELWKYDGTSATLIADIYPGQLWDNSFPNGFQEYNGSLYFQADNGWSSNGTELWKYTTGSAPTIVADLHPSGNSYPSNLTVFNGELYFRADNGTVGTELFKTDGTTISLVQDINSGASGSNPNFLTIVSNKLYFRAYSNSLSGDEMHYYDPTLNTVTQAQELQIGPSGSEIFKPIVFMNKIVMEASESDSLDQQLYEYDPVTDDWTMLKHIEDVTRDANIKKIVEFNNELFFFAKREDANGSGTYLHHYNGTTTDTITNNMGLNQGIGKTLLEFNNSLYYASSSDNIIKYDGTNFSILLAANSAGNIDFMKVVGSKLFFNYNDGSSGRELWMYDGTNPPTLVADLSSSSWNGGANSIVTQNGQFYFSGITGSWAKELYSFDGTNPPTQIFNLGASNNTNAGYLTVFNNKVIFSAQTDTSGKEMWEYDGTNFTMLTYNASNNGDPGNYFEYNGNLYFSNYTNNEGYELWSYDGINSPTIVQDFNSGPSDGISSSNMTFEIFNNKLVYSGRNSSSKIVNTYDGTTITPYDIRHVNQVYANPGAYKAWGSWLYLSGDLGTGEGEELLRMCFDKTNAIADTVCGKYISSSNTVYTTNGIYTETFTTNTPCDSVVTFDITIKQLPVVTIGSFDDTVCIEAINVPLPFVSPSGGTFSGAGLSGNLVETQTAGVGVHNIIYEFTSNNGCTNTDTTVLNIINCTALSIEDKQLGNIEVLVYPNPNNGNFYINNSSGLTLNYNVIDVAGKLVLQTTSAQSVVNVNLQNQENGIYFLQVVNGTSINTLKIIKQ